MVYMRPFSALNIFEAFIQASPGFPRKYQGTDDEGTATWL